MWLSSAAAGTSKGPATGVHRSRGVRLAACIAALTCAAAAQAHAGDHVVIETGVVKTRDLDLATAHGARVLLRRVTAMADDLCTSTSPPEHAAQTVWRACVAKAVARTIAPIKAPLVTAEYGRAFGEPQPAVSSR